MGRAPARRLQKNAFNRARNSASYASAKSYADSAATRAAVTARFKSRMMKNQVVGSAATCSTAFAARQSESVARRSGLMRMNVGWDTIGTLAVIFVEFVK